MLDKDDEFFKSILEKQKKDEELWDAYNAQDEVTWHIPAKREDEIMERMFLVYHLKKYMEQNDL